MRRSWVPARLTGAIDNTLARWQDLLDVIEQHPPLLDGVRSADLLTKTEGRPRGSGDWVLAYLLFVNSAERELTRWHRSTSDELWQRIGFDKTPSYHAAYKNFNALEGHECAFRTIAARLIHVARERSDDKVGHAVHVDGTEAEAHSRLIHDCDGDELASCSKQAQLPGRVTNADARQERHRLAAEQPTDDPLYGAADEIVEDERGKRVKVNDCWYLLSDVDAGIRAYTAKDGRLRRFWAGYYSIKAIDHYTGGVLAVHVVDASTQEHVAYPDVFDQLCEQLGTTPKAVVADRGYSLPSVFELHTRADVATVIPWRTHHTAPKRENFPRFDRHGVPRCKYCDGETTYERFQHDSGPKDEPRLWFRCARPATPECERSQTIFCKENWRLLLPLWRTAPAYQVLRATHSAYESAHHRWRERYAVAGDTKADRPKRRGLGVQQLRASAALVIEWLTICHRQGWLGGPVLNERAESVISRDEADAYCARLVARRQALGLSGVEPELMGEHQAAVADAYGGGASGMGAGSAYGKLVTAMLAEEPAPLPEQTE